MHPSHFISEKIKNFLYDVKILFEKRNAELDAERGRSERCARERERKRERDDF